MKKERRQNKELCPCGQGFLFAYTARSACCAHAARCACGAGCVGSLAVQVGPPVGPALGLALGCELGLELVQGIEGLKRREGVEVESFNALHQLLLLCHFRFGCSGTGLLFTHLGL